VEVAPDQLEVEVEANGGQEIFVVGGDKERQRLGEAFRGDLLGEPAASALFEERKLRVRSAL
jgi:hypothetical protein